METMRIEWMKRTKMRRLFVLTQNYLISTRNERTINGTEIAVLSAFKEHL
jgi:hypothetical protein